MLVPRLKEKREPISASNPPASEPIAMPALSRIASLAVTRSSGKLFSVAWSMISASKLPEANARLNPLMIMPISSRTPERENRNRV